MSIIKVLIVEDELIIAEDMKEMLHELQYQVIGIARDNKSAEEKLNSQIPDIALVDIQLRNNDNGIDLGKTIKEKYNIPIVFVTSHTDKNTLEKAKLINPEGYIVKPFEKADLYTAIELAIFNHTSHKKAESETKHSATMNNLSSMDEQFIEAFYKCVDENIGNEKLTVDDLAQYIGISRSMLHRRLVRITGKSTNDLLTERRLTLARELLENDVATVSEIAFRVGFSSPSYFSKVFKQYFQLSPLALKHKVPAPMTESVVSKQEESFKPLRKSRFVPFFIIASTLIVIVLAALLFVYLNRMKLEKSIAVLPFENISTSAENRFLADGMVEDLISRLSQIGGLKVISRTSTEIFRDKGSHTIPEIARKLGVGYIIEGSVQRDADKVRITFQLIDAISDNHVLSKQYTRDLNDVFKLQGEIAGQIASELSLMLTQKQKTLLNFQRTNSLKAFELCQMGRYHSGKRWIEGYKTSNEYFVKALKEDPEYGLAYAGLADNYHLMTLQNWIDLKEGKPKAIELANKAIKLDPYLAEPYAVLGAISSYFDHDWEHAETNFNKALLLNASYASAYQYYSELKAAKGDMENARLLINKAIELDPCSFVIRYFSAVYYFYSGNYKLALEETLICEELIANHEWPVTLEFRIYAAMKDENNAVKSFKKLGNVFAEWSEGCVDSIYNATGLHGLIRNRLDRGIWVYEYEKAQYYMMLGEEQNALQAIEKALESGFMDPIELYAPEYFPLRQKQAFKEIRKSMNLPEL